MARIQWDTEASDGGNELSSPRANPFNRFFDYAPDVDVIGPVAQAIGNKLEYVFEFGAEDYFAHLEIHHLSADQLADAQALQAWLLRRKVVTVDDGEGNTNDACYLKPGTRPTIENADDTRGHFSFVVDLRSASPIVVNYAP